VKENSNWLNEMLDAAFMDPPDETKEPNYQTIRIASSTAESFHPGILPHHKRRLFISAAATFLSISIAIPTGIATGRHISRKKLIIEQNTLFVEELIGNTLFDEGLDPGDCDTWIFTNDFNDSFFDI